MKVGLLWNTPLPVAIIAARTCYDSMSQSDTLDMTSEYLGARDTKLLTALIAKGHHSVIEHINYSFKITGISRGCLQQLVRHRIGSFSVQSTRYCLGRLRKERNVISDAQRLADIYLVESNNRFVNECNKHTLTAVVQGAHDRIPNDDLKYMLPEAFKTDLVWSVNARTLRNFFALRMPQEAHWEIRELAKEVYVSTPDTHKGLFVDVLGSLDGIYIEDEKEIK